VSPRRGPRLLPWTLTLVLATVAIVDGVHASYLAFYLPSGINVRLIKAALWLGLLALLGFFTALLHSLHERPYGRRSRILLWFIALASLYVIVERREAYRPRTEAFLRSAAARPAPQRLVVVGIEGATLDAILPLAEQGFLPFLDELLREGAHVRVPPQVPVRREPSWASAVTGKHPFKHGVLDDLVFSAPGLGPGAELRLQPLGIGFPRWGTFGAGYRHVGRADRRALALWEILSRFDRAVGVVGWGASSPVEGDVEFLVSERLFSGDTRPQVASSADLVVSAELFQPTDQEIDRRLLIEAGDPPHPTVLAAARQDCWRRDLALFLDGRQQVEDLFLRLPGLDLVSRMTFGAFAAQQLEGISDPLLDPGVRNLVAYYRFVDQSLAQIWSHRDTPALFVVVATHGISTPSWWRRWRRTVGKSGGVVDANADGLFLFRGGGIRAGAFVPRADTVDIAPTLLYAMGLPVSRDLDGRVLTGVFTETFLERRPVAFLPSYEALGAEP
jgi:hypothetical protein